MAGLAAWLTATFAPTATHALAARESIRRRRLRRDRRILVPQRKLPLQIRDLFLFVRDLPGLFGDLLFALRERASQAFHLLLQSLCGVLVLLSLGARHGSHGTPIRSICTAP